MLETQSPAMDIQVASNFERLYFEAVGREAAETARAFAAFAAGSAITLPTQAQRHVDSLFQSVSVSEEKTAHAIGYADLQTGEVLDPHTATAYVAATATALGGTPVIVLSTAHPAKFPDAVRAAIGREPDLHDRARDLHTRVERIDRLPADLDAVKAYVRAFAQQ